MGLNPASELAGFVPRPKIVQLILAAFDHSRLVTLIGPPGIGKTTVAAMADAADDAERPFLTVRVRAPSRDGAGAVAEHLAEERGRRVLAIASEALELATERVVVVPPLALPDVDRPPGSSLAVEALRLAAVRRRAGLDPSPSALIDIARRLDGVPWLLDAAGRKVALFGAEEVQKRIATDLAFLDEDGTLAQRLRAEWEALDETQRSTLAEVSVFRDGFSFESAETILQRDASATLSQLCAKSWIQFDPARSRFVVLRYLREFAAQQLQSSDALHRRHAEHYGTLAARWAPQCWGPRATEALAALSGARANLEAVAERGMAQAPSAAWGFLETALAEGGLERAAKRFEATASTTDPASVPAAAWACYATALQSLGRFDEAAEAVAHIGDDPVVTSLLLARNAHGQGGAQSALDAAHAAARAAESADHVDQARAQAALGQALERVGDLDRARTALEHAVALAREAACERELALANLSLSQCLLQPSTLQDAYVHALEAASTGAQVGDLQAKAIATGVLALVEHVRGTLDTLAERYDLAREQFLRAGMTKNAAVALGYRGMLDVETQDETAATHLQGAVDELSAMGEGYYRTLCIGFLAGLRAKQGATRRARTLFATAGDLAVELQSEPLEKHLAIQRVHLDQRGKALDTELAEELLRIADLQTFECLDLSISLRTHPWRRLRVAEDGKTVQVGFRFPVTLARRPVLARAVVALAVRHRSTELPLDFDALGERLWPGERMDAKSGRNRLRVTIATLRQLGLADVLETVGSNYRFRPDWDVMLKP